MNLMGIYDRDYYRREGPSYLEALIPSGRVCIWLICINVAVFAVQTLTRPSAHDLFTSLFMVSADQVFYHGQVWRLLTYAFLHANFWHVAINMLFLWWFGSELERMYGSMEFLAFYLVAAFLGGVAWCAYTFAIGDMVPCLGASGAVTALLILFAFHFPTRQILIFFLLPVPIWLFAVFNVAQDVFGLLGGGSGNQVAWVVHLAGAGFAALYYTQHWHILGLWQSLRSLKLPRARPPLRLYHPESDDSGQVPVAAAARNPDLDEHLEAKLDAVLAKVASFGQGSLTEAERQILLRASEIYRRKRT